MEFYRILLVDDEEEVRKSIIRKIDWNSVGFTVVGDAENGEDALEKVELLDPDVVLTDIRMPYMDGLTLSEKIRQKYPLTKIVIFSGYDDFEYAKRAIKLNVTEYILKPVNVEELTAILKKIKTNLDEEIEQKRNVNLLRENYRKSLPILRDQFLKELISRQVDPAIVKDRMQEYEIHLDGAKKWIAFAVDIGKEKEQDLEAIPLHGEKALLPISVMQIMDEYLTPSYRHILFNISGAGEAGLAGIVAIDETNTQTDLINMLGDICKEIKKILKVPVTVGIGHSTLALDKMYESFQSAADALGYKSIVGEGNTIYISDVEPVTGGKLLFEGQDESEIISAVKFGPESKIHEAVSKIMGRMSEAKVHARQYQAYMFGAMNCMIQLAQQYDLDMNRIFEDATDPVNILPQISQKENFDQWLLPVALRISRALNEERDNSARRAMERAKQYISDNYQDPDLSVEQLCRYLHMSPAYFSTVFKKATGQTYVAYLTEVRLNKAVELLNKTDDKTYVIASKVGYPEQNYFSYVFKKRFGVSPTKFRGSK